MWKWKMENEIKIKKKQKEDKEILKCIHTIWKTKERKRVWERGRQEKAITSEERQERDIKEREIIKEIE